MEHEERRGDEAEPLVGSVNRKSVKKAAKVKARKGKFVAANMLDSGTDAASREEGEGLPRWLV